MKTRPWTQGHRDVGIQGYSTSGDVSGAKQLRCMGAVGYQSAEGGIGLLVLVSGCPSVHPRMIAMALGQPIFGKTCLN